MRAVVITELAGPQAVAVRDVPEPQHDPGQVLIDVHYAGVSFPDVLHTRGQYQMRPTLPFTPGWDVSGVVRTAAGDFRAGDRVAAMPVIGGLAETVAVNPENVFPLPDSVSFAKGAALPLNYLTAHFALVRRARLRAGETVLVHGAAGGVGTAMCGLAAAMGARVIATASSTAKGDIAKSAGAHEVLHPDGFAKAVMDTTDGRGVDVIVDPVGGRRFTDSLGALACEGRVLVVGFTSGEIPTVRTNKLLLTNTTVMGAACKEFWDREPGYPREQWAELRPLFESGVLDPIVGHEFGLPEAAEAIAVLDERRATGKVVVRVR